MPEKSANWINYETRLNRVTDYIYAHLDEPLDLDKLARVAYLSPYHFHRIYRAARGETIATTVRHLRLHRAAAQLAQADLSIEYISSTAGYQNVQSFTRAFNERYAMPPARYRKLGSHSQYQPTHLARSLTMHNVTLRTLPDLEVLSVSHTGSYLQISRAFEQLGGWLGARNLISPDSRMFGVYYDDPASVAEAQLRSRACISVSQTCALEPPLERVTIAGGEYAVLRHKGAYAALPAAYEWLFGVWLAQVGRALRDAPALEEYLNTPMDTAPEDLLTEIYVPLC
ncbi:MAG: AraC family transcriptional regulator [Sideroxydans sp.]|nr:AraC family transcriptional regulator [Sideroxydans sp.]